MARIVGGSMIGELSGKLGGNVFARNKAGAYIRQYVIPVNPNTAAQVDARTAFGSSSSSYHSLTDLQKAQWNNFAQNLYLPKNGVNTGQFSGFNAFTALRNAAQNANRLFIGSPTVLVNGTANTITDIQPFLYLSDPPTDSIQGNLGLVGGGSIGLSVSIGAVNTLGEFTFQLALGSGSSPTPSDINDTLTNGAGQEVGFAVYMSNPVQQEAMFISNPEIYSLGYIPNFTLATGTGTSAETITISGSVVNPAQYQSWVSANDIVRISIYMITRGGQMIRIGADNAIVAPVI